MKLLKQTHHKDTLKIETIYTSNVGPGVYHLLICTNLKYPEVTEGSMSLEDDTGTIDLLFWDDQEEIALELSFEGDYTLYKDRGKYQHSFICVERTARSSIYSNQTVIFDGTKLEKILE